MVQNYVLFEYICDLCITNVVLTLTIQGKLVIKSNLCNKIVI